MTPAEAAALLTVAAAFDNRKPDEDQARAWAAALGDLPFRDCRDVIVKHYQGSREWLMPVEVIAGVKRLRRERLAAYGPIEPPASLDPDDVAGQLAWLRERERQIADGEITAPEPPPALEMSADRSADMAALRELLGRHKKALLTLDGRAPEHDPRRQADPETETQEDPA